MKLNSKINSPLLPRPSQSSVLELGLSHGAMAEWLAVDDDLPIYHAHKLQQIDSHPGEVIAALPESDSAQKEFGRLLLTHLTVHHGQRYATDGLNLSTKDGRLQWPLPATDLQSCSLWIQEDICLLQALNDEYILTAASVCSPSNWRLPDKIGKTLGAIHDPVPGYRDILHSRTNRLLNKLSKDKVIFRYNWSVQAGNELCWRPDLYAAQEPAELYWRVERQTLRRLPETGAIVFGIRIFLESFTRLESRQPGFTATLREIIEHLPEAQRRYKGLDVLLERPEFGAIILRNST